jgi:hypothetical protein
MGVQALADMSDVERKLALERYELLEPHLQNGRELRSVSKGSDVSFRTLQRWVAGYKREGLAGLVRLLTRLQVERVLSVNDAQVISVEIVEAARDSLVIGQA